ncbi:MAG: hypothetical protein JST82_02170 [Bacteroidetes bacterium]|nr:hypothetical protein [Bacteroidota bacterium]
MSARELVMAILCKPLSGKELLQTEKANNVIIHRKIEYVPKTDNNAIEDFIKHLRRLPLKLMFVFSLSDIIIVNSTDDLNDVARRLLAM